MLTPPEDPRRRKRTEGMKLQKEIDHSAPNGERLARGKIKKNPA